MARHRRRPRRQPKTMVQLMQILGLIVALMFLFFFRDQFATNASNLMGAFDGGDIKVSEKPAADTNSQDMGQDEGSKNSAR